MEKQTAVEWLFEEWPILKSQIPPYIFEAANQMFQEQIMKAFSDGQETPLNNPTLPHYSREEYYKEKYKG